MACQSVVMVGVVVERLRSYTTIHVVEDSQYLAPRTGFPLQASGFYFLVPGKKIGTL